MNYYTLKQSQPTLLPLHAIIVSIIRQNETVLQTSSKDSSVSHTKKVPTNS